VEGYATADLPDNASILVAVVREVAGGAVLATVKRNDTRCFHAWITRDGHDYLLSPEDLEGQTVVDLTTGRIERFSAPDGAGPPGPSALVQHLAPMLRATSLCGGATTKTPCRK
jgi:hypothetical protein